MEEILNTTKNSSTTSSDDLPETAVLYSFKLWYEQYHGNVSVVVCVCGIIMNIFNIVVLSQRKMRTTSNVILTALAVSDMLTMASYIPFALQFYVLHGLTPNPERNCWQWAYFLIFHANFTVTVHTISIWLCVLLAVFRYSYVRVSSNKLFVINMRRTIVAIILVYALSVIILIPNYMTLTIVTTSSGAGVAAELGNSTMYHVTYVNSTHSMQGYLVTSINFWIHAILIKILPCLLMSVFGFLLVWTMHAAKKKRKQLRKASAAANGANNAKARNKQKAKDHTRTTSMLVVVILLFLITELPQGILALMSPIIEGFHEAYYVPLGDLMDIIALINNAINFILYCSMSKQFRDTFLTIFCRCCPSNRNKALSGGNVTAAGGQDYSLYTALKRLVNRQNYQNPNTIPIFTADDDVSYAKTDL